MFSNLWHLADFSFSDRIFYDIFFQSRTPVCRETFGASLGVPDCSLDLKGLKFLRVTESLV